jgi:hypothetical protein
MEVARTRAAEEVVVGISMVDGRGGRGPSLGTCYQSFIQKKEVRQEGRGGRG